mgnify:CR=1 FL=1
MSIRIKVHDIKWLANKKLLIPSRANFNLLCNQISSILEYQTHKGTELDFIIDEDHVVFDIVSKNKDELELDIIELESQENAIIDNLSKNIQHVHTYNKLVCEGKNEEALLFDKAQSNIPSKLGNSLSKLNTDSIELTLNDDEPLYIEKTQAIKLVQGIPETKTLTECLINRPELIKICSASFISIQKNNNTTADLIIPDNLKLMTLELAIKGIYVDIEFQCNSREKVKKLSGSLTKITKSSFQQINMPD